MNLRLPPYINTKRHLNAHANQHLFFRTQIMSLRIGDVAPDFQCQSTKVRLEWQYFISSGC
jgi:hypothetical protein